MSSNVLAQIKALQSERVQLVNRLAIVDADLREIRAALGMASPRAPADVQTPRPTKVNGHRPSTPAPGGVAQGASRLPSAEMRRRVLASLQLREPQTRLSIEEDAQHYCGTVLARLVEDRVLVRRAWRLDESGTRPPYYYATTVDALDAMERELIDSGQVESRPTTPDTATSEPNVGAAMPTSVPPSSESDPPSAS